MLGRVQEVVMKQKCLLWVNMGYEKQPWQWRGWRKDCVRWYTSSDWNVSISTARHGEGRKGLK